MSKNLKTKKLGILGMMLIPCAFPGVLLMGFYALGCGSGIPTVNLYDLKGTISEVLLPLIWFSIIPIIQIIMWSIYTIKNKKNNRGKYMVAGLIGIIVFYIICLLGLGTVDLIKSYSFIKSDETIEYITTKSVSEKEVNNNYNKYKEIILKYLDEKYPEDAGNFKLEYLCYSEHSKYAPSISAIVINKDYPDKSFTVEHESRLLKPSEEKKTPLSELYVDGYKLTSTYSYLYDVLKNSVSKFDTENNIKCYLTFDEYSFQEDNYDAQIILNEDVTEDSIRKVSNILFDFLQETSGYKTVTSVTISKYIEDENTNKNLILKTYFAPHIFYDFKFKGKSFYFFSHEEHGSIDDVYNIVKRNIENQTKK